MSETPDEIPVVTRTLTCHTEGCANAGHAIRLDVPEDVGSFGCGVCGQPITDVT